MSSVRVLAFSSSRVNSSAYLETVVPVVEKFLGAAPYKIAFIPFASADNDYDDYRNKVSKAFAPLPYQFKVVKPENATSVIESADVIMTGGGNTFKLLHDLYDLKIVQLIVEKVQNGSPYIGWSAGSNITGLTIGTTNDMPIVQPESFRSFGFFPFQINPHYISVKAEGHNGETRDERLIEYLKLNQKSTIIALPEGTALLREGDTLSLVGNVPAVMFHCPGSSKQIIRSEINVDTDLSWLLKN